MKTLPIFLLAGGISILSLAACNKDQTGNNTTPPQDTTGNSKPSIRVLRSDLHFPWEILWGKDDHIWMTERSGKISKLDPKTGNTVFSHTIGEVVTRGEGGLLGMVQHPGFNDNGYFYVVYNYLNNNQYLEKVVRLTYVNNSVSSPLVVIENIPAANIHNGSRLWITEGDPSYLFISTGDAAVSSQAQNTSSLSGKVLRLHTDGSIPADNPIPGNPLWTFGHRNPQGMVMVNNILYTSEHGPSIEDEVNIIEKGKNYGWPEVNGPCSGLEITFCTTNAVREPIWSTGGSTFALSGMDYYNHDRIPAWKNSLLVTSLKNTTLYQLQLNTDATAVSTSKPFFTNNWGRLRDVCISPDGSVYICTSNGGNSDKLVEINKAD